MAALHRGQIKYGCVNNWIQWGLAARVQAWFILLPGTWFPMYEGVVDFTLKMNGLYTNIDEFYTKYDECYTKTDV